MDLEKPSEFLTLASYQKLKSFPSLKGFLKPFKGKGDYELLKQQALELRECLNQFVVDMSKLMKSPPWSLLNIELRAHHSWVGTIFLRWRSRDMSKMGVWLWEEQMLNPKTPVCLLEELQAIEQMRIAINMQMSITQNLVKLASENGDKSVHAETVLARRLGGETVAEGDFPAPLVKVGRKRKNRTRERDELY